LSLELINAIVHGESNSINCQAVKDELVLGQSTSLVTEEVVD